MHQNILKHLKINPLFGKKSILTCLVTALAIVIKFGSNPPFRGKYLDNLF